MYGTGEKPAIGYNFYIVKGKMTMEEKVIKNKQNPKNVRKKVYTSPALTVYGKLAELTTAGSGNTLEVGSSTKNKRP